MTTPHRLERPGYPGARKETMSNKPTTTSTRDQPIVRQSDVAIDNTAKKIVRRLHLEGIVKAGDITQARGMVMQALREDETRDSASLRAIRVAVRNLLRGSERLLDNGVGDVRFENGKQMACRLIIESLADLAVED